MTNARLRPIYEKERRETEKMDEMDIIEALEADDKAERELEEARRWGERDKAELQALDAAAPPDCQRSGPRGGGSTTGKGNGTGW